MYTFLELHHSTLPVPMLSIGYSGERIVNGADLESVFTCKVGGEGIGFRHDADTETEVVGKLSEISDLDLTCGCCHRGLFLITQFHAPVDDWASRVLYLYACNSTPCMDHPQSWRVVRGQFSKAVTLGAKQATKEDTRLQLPIFGRESSAFDLSKLKDLVSQATRDKATRDTLCAKGSGALRFKSAKDQPAFPPVYLEFYEDGEESSAGSSVQEYAHEARLEREYKATQGLSGSSDFTGEKYEKVKHKYYHSHFKHFHRLVTQDPEQCVRYSLGGSPVFFKRDRVSEDVLSLKLPSCRRCGSPVRFEFQLMPKVLCCIPRRKFLDESNSASSNGSMVGDKFKNLDQGVDFGTVLVYTCSLSCDLGQSGFSEETVLVQHDTI